MLPLNANSLSERKGDLRSRKIARFGLVISLSLVMTIAFQKNDAVAQETTNHYRQWAFIQLNDLDQFYCLDELNYKESRWNPKAKNGITPKRIAELAGQIHCVALIDWLTTKCAHFRSQCDRKAALKCTGCRSVAYCSKEHQTADWEVHRHDCKSISTYRKTLAAQVAPLGKSTKKKNKKGRRK